jgi:hypothetical protein
MLAAILIGTVLAVVVMFVTIIVTDKKPVEKKLTLQEELQYDLLASPAELTDAKEFILAGGKI